MIPRTDRAARRPPPGALGVTCAGAVRRAPTIGDPAAGPHPPHDVFALVGADGAPRVASCNRLSRPARSPAGAQPDSPTETHREARTADSLVQLARRRRGDRADPRPDRAPGRRHRPRLDLGHGPLLPDPRRRPGRGADARRLDGARVPRREHDERPARADGRRRPLPAAGAVGEGRDDARRPVRRAGLARDRGRLERGRVAQPRLPVPAPRRAVRDARGDAPDRPRDVAGRAWLGGRVRRPPVSTPAA